VKKVLNILKNNLTSTKLSVKILNVASERSE